ncbi:imidazole glycerol phosphate synthase subunit HisH [Geothrix edaphica]|uniref:Imidazole glycerol phosphate synthase subunit HisH n=1 Tax=Geothrix edaphica TaxID=2927976 RepID=A0ABQ5PTM4_9BACT|nr:imidazole glycerol phosphate synthase subunit HisH [Geothrix edaphica]GLH65683.1 imidazole glycerol phosphate synthase subunit HisH 2 [Geothrix edaphica]
MITIVDYGLGNISAFANVYKRLNMEVRFAREAADLGGAERIILPGVGAFDHAMERLERSGMRETLDHLVLKERIPVLGVCVGMQILTKSSEEGSRPGLSWIEGQVRSFRSDPRSAGLPLPHMGWNDVVAVQENPLFRGLEDQARFYFLHTFYMECAAPTDVAAKASYGFDFHCAVNHDNIYGVQFHPEKSHHFGQQLLKNFGEL